MSGFVIESVSQSTLESVFELEQRLEGERAADLPTLVARQQMFPQGFLVARQGTQVLGYIESCL